MSDDNRKSGGGKGRPPRGPGSGRDRKDPSRSGSRPDGRGFKGKRPEGRSFSDRRSEGRSDRPSSGETMIKGAFRPRKPREEGARPDTRPKGEGRSFSENRSQEGGKRRFSPSKGPRRSFSEGAGGERPSRPPRERREGDRARSDRPPGDRSRGDRSRGDRPFRAHPSGDRPSGDRPFRERREGDRPQGDRPFRARSSGDRPFRERGEGDRPRSPRPPRDGSFRDQGKPRGRPQGGRDRRDFSAPKARPGDRIAKVMARAGLCSRRDAEAWILEGRVIVNGETLLTPARDIVPSDRVEVDGKPLPLRERTRLFLYHKSRGLVTTARDPEGRPTVFAQLPKGLPRLISVGRLDINTEGLLLLTNDGGLARIIELPDTGWLRRYRVRCFGEIDQSTLDSLRDGVMIDGMHYGPIEATLDREKGDNVWLTLGLREGKNREVKRVLEHFGLAVNRLIRVSFGPFQLGELAEGAVEEVRTGFLRHQISPEMVTASGVDFDGPIFNYDEDFDDIAPKKFERRDERSRDSRAPRRDDARGSDRREQSRGPRRDEDRGSRRSFDRNDRVSPRGDRPDRPPRFDTRTPEAGADEKPARPLRPHRNEVQKKIWRADDVQEKAATRSTPKAPRRGFDPKKARAENAERTHERAGRIQTRSGKSVTVEKLAPRKRSESGRDSRPSQGKGAPRSKGPRPPRGQ